MSATLILSVATNMIIPKKPQKKKYQPSNPGEVAWASLPPAGSRSRATTLTQKRPYERKAVVPKVLPFLHSMIPAIICATPP